MTTFNELRSADISRGQLHVQSAAKTLKVKVSSTETKDDLFNKVEKALITNKFVTVPEDTKTLQRSDDTILKPF